MGVFEALGRLEATLSGEIRGLRSTIERDLRAEATREKVVERLHAELQEYKQDLLLRMMRPVFLDLIQLRDDIEKFLESHPRRAPLVPGEDPGTSEPPAAAEDPARLLTFVQGLRQGIDDILSRQGVDPFTCEGPAFNPRHQRALATIPAEAPEQVRSVAVRHRVGFRAGERVIRPELVTVYSPRTASESPP